ncbi:T9SS type A sorting domain-containing protein, partial [Candidatus Amoebophilus asiaticus]|nr:T9SS type A sorting domain-containing protein [Candidatus Amoebophilus asiaticus]
VAIVEQEINYPAPPGSNGEKNFYNVFRKMLTNMAGDTCNLAMQGDSVTFTYSYQMDTLWDSTRIYALAYVQNTDTKEIINSGTRFDPPLELVATGDVYVKGANGSQSVLGIKAINISNDTGNYKITLSDKAPVGWSANFSIGGTNYNDSAIVQILPQSSLNDIEVNVTPDATAGIGIYTLTATSLSDATMPPQSQKVYVISGVTDLIVYNEQPWGDQEFYDYNSVFTNGLSYAGNTSFTMTGHKFFVKSMKRNILDDVKRIYFNVGWTFPSLNDELVAEFTNFLNAGGRLFISGQDIGWDQESGHQYANGTPNTQGFYSNYLQAEYIDDGSSSIGTIYPFPGDGVFGPVVSAGLVDKYNGNMYPDVVNPIGVGSPIFYYNNDTSMIGGIRSIKSDSMATWKTVYLATSLEMINDSNVTNEILKLSHDWFRDLISVEEYDRNMKHLMISQNYPNPGDHFTKISFRDITDNTILQIMDMLGKIILERPVKAGSYEYILNTSLFDPGIYLYQIMDENGNVIQARRMAVIH